MKNSLVTAASLAVLAYLLWRDAMVAGAAIFSAFALVLPFLYWYEPRMVFHPNYPTRRVEQTPAQIGLAFEEVHLSTPEGETIHGWFIPRQNATLTVLFLHGNAGNISHRLDRISIFHDLQVNLFLIDYRGYGNSSGQPNEKNTYIDARAAYDYLVQERGISSQSIVIYGESLGTAISVDLAAQVPCGGIILEAAFTSVPDVAQKMFPFLPVRPFVRNRYDSLSKIGNIRAPLLILHSRTDGKFAMTHAERLLAAAPPPKSLIELKGGHGDGFLVSGDLYRHALKDFFGGLHYH